MDAMVQISNVSFAYPKQSALSDVSLTIQPGEFLGLMGPNSSGKSTLLRLLSRELQPTQGTIYLQNKPLQRWSLMDLARKVTVVSSDEHFNFPFTVKQLVLMGRTPYIPRAHRETAHDIARAREAMQATDVLVLQDRSIVELSSGERQRVLLARALAQEPRVLILDEPTVHLDVGHAWQFFELLQRLHHENQLTIICALHDLSLAAAHCSRLVMLQNGQLHAEGRPAEVLTQETLREVFGVSLPMAAFQFRPMDRVAFTIE